MKEARMQYEFNDDGGLKKLSQEELLAADEVSYVIVKNTGIQNDGKPYWAYVAVRPSKYHEFMEYTREQRTVKLADYGRVLRYGLGTEIPDTIKKEMKARYRCDDAYLEKLTNDVNTARLVFMKEREDERISSIVAMLKNKTLH